MTNANPANPAKSFAFNRVVHSLKHARTQATVIPMPARVSLTQRCDSTPWYKQCHLIDGITLHLPEKCPMND